MNSKKTKRHARLDSSGYVVTILNTWPGSLCSLQTILMSVWGNCIWQSRRDPSAAELDVAHHTAQWEARVTHGDVPADVRQRECPDSVLFYGGDVSCHISTCSYMYLSDILPLLLFHSQRRWCVSVLMHQEETVICPTQFRFCDLHLILQTMTDHRQIIKGMFTHSNCDPIHHSTAMNSSVVKPINVARRHNSRNNTQQ